MPLPPPAPPARPAPEALERARAAHAQCRQAWADLSPSALRGVAVHGVEAHLTPSVFSAGRYRRG